MDRITLKNYRCFREEQSARLAPLTLLVGDNSTGKTSFLAMIRALYDLAIGSRYVDFKEAPYDLGSFDEIAHHRGARGGRAEVFEAGLETTVHSPHDNNGEVQRYRAEVSFGKVGTAPVPIRRRYGVAGNWIEERLIKDNIYTFEVGTSRGSWRITGGATNMFTTGSSNQAPLQFVVRLALIEARSWKEESELLLEFFEGTPDIKSSDMDRVQEILNSITLFGRNRPFASAPVRSKPHRTYDPSPTMPDAEGDSAPMYLANVSFRDRKEWRLLKEKLEDFGRKSGLFSEINVKRLGRNDSAPFQVQVRKFGRRRKGPWRNLIDVGYGVSQVLPVLTDLLRPDGPDTFLLQQPEIHLHPSAQAALGSMFCQAAATGKQLVVETHSDHLIDRVRMDVRDGETALKPEDVSILFFERNELDVRIHSIRVDDEGNIRDAPEGYRQFFMEETRRSLWSLRNVRNRRCECHRRGVWTRAVTHTRSAEVLRMA